MEITENNFSPFAAALLQMAKNSFESAEEFYQLLMHEAPDNSILRLMNERYNDGSEFAKEWQKQTILARLILPI